MLFSENTLNSAHAELCLCPPHTWQWLNTTSDHSKRVSEQRGDVWVTSVTFSTHHSATRQIFYCLSHALCLFMKDRNKCQVSTSLWPSPIPGFPSSLWMHQSRLHQQKDWVWFAVFCDLPWPPHLLPGQKDSVWWCQCVFHGFHCLPFSFISTISLYISCKISPGGHCSVVFYTVSLSHIPGNLSLPSPQHLYCLPWEANKHTQVKVQQKSLQILL